MAGRVAGSAGGDSLIKRQGITYFGGGYAHSYGGLYVGTEYLPTYHDIGVAISGSSGEFTSMARFSAVDMLAYFKSRNPTASRVEAEGVFISGSGRPMTLIMTNPSDSHAGGMHVVEFYSDSVDAVDMRSSLATVPTVVQTPIWVPPWGGRSSDLPLLNPMTGKRLDSITKICTYMGETQTNEIRFYSTNFPGILDDAMGGVIPSSTWVTITNWNGNTYELRMQAGDKTTCYTYNATAGAWTIYPFTSRAASLPGSPGTVIGDTVYAHDPEAMGCLGWVWFGTPAKWVAFGVNGATLQGKKWLTLGDSITAYSGSYPELAAKRLQMRLTNAGVSNTRMSGTSANQQNDFCNKTAGSFAAGYDVITVAFGANDSGSSVTIGTLGSTDKTTFYGGMEVGYANIIAANPTARVIFLLPTYRTSNGGDSKVKPYRDAIKAFCASKGLPCIPCNEEMGINLATATTFLSDGLHLTAAGKALHGSYVAAKLTSLI